MKKIPTKKNEKKNKGKNVQRANFSPLSPWGRVGLFLHDDFDSEKKVSLVFFIFFIKVNDWGRRVWYTRPGEAPVRISECVFGGDW